MGSNQFSTKPSQSVPVRLLCCKIELIRQLGAASSIRIPLPLPLPNLDCPGAYRLRGTAPGYFRLSHDYAEQQWPTTSSHTPRKPSCRLSSFLDYSRWHPGEHWLPWALWSTVERLQPSHPPHYVQDATQDGNQSHRDQAQIGMSVDLENVKELQAHSI